MSYSPPKRLTLVVSFLILALGIFLLICIVFPPLPEYWPVVEIGDLNSYEFWGVIAIICVSASWFLLYIGIKYRGI